MNITTLTAGASLFPSITEAGVQPSKRNVKSRYVKRPYLVGNI
ncbi:hypothetical protein AALF16_23455 [Bacillus cereus]